MLKLGCRPLSECHSKHGHGQCREPTVSQVASKWRKRASPAVVISIQNNGMLTTMPTQYPSQNRTRPSTQSLASLVLPLVLTAYALRGRAVISPARTEAPLGAPADLFERNLMFCLGLGILVAVPVFKTVIQLPPFGGSILIISSPAGVAAMGLERIHFFWYVRKISGLALARYFAGAGVYLLQHQMLT